MLFTRLWFTVVQSIQLTDIVYLFLFQKSFLKREFIQCKLSVIRLIVHAVTRFSPQDVVMVSTMYFVRKTLYKPDRFEYSNEKFDKLLKQMYEN